MLTTLVFVLLALAVICIAAYMVARGVGNIPMDPMPKGLFLAAVWIVFGIIALVVGLGLMGVSVPG